jgi:signal peptidase I
VETIQPGESEPEQIPVPDLDLARPATRERVSIGRTFGGTSLLREIAETVLLTLMIFLVLNTTTGRFQVRGSSMEPTLHDGQYLIISKLIYWMRSPERGDVIVFEPPGNPDEDYIKRVIGLPGEQVEIRDGIVSINGAPLKEPYIESPAFYSGTWNLGAGEYFVLGDNRRNSSDSHSWGVLPHDNVVGKAWLCYWPPEEWGMVAHESFSHWTDRED